MIKQLTSRVSLITLPNEPDDGTVRRVVIRAHHDSQGRKRKKTLYLLPEDMDALARQWLTLKITGRASWG